MKPKIIGLGELLWDMLPSGARMGGAPANFTCHANALGADAAVISRVGEDESGTRLLCNLEALGVSIKTITRDPEHPTGTVMVSLGHDGQPGFEICRAAAWDHLEATPEQFELVRKADAICFGSLGQRSASSRSAIRELVSAAPPHALKVFDVNLREEFFTADILDDSLNLANVCKLSDAELPIIVGMLGLEGNTRQQLHELLVRYDLRMVIFTRGANGSLLYNGREWSEHPGLPTEVRDTIGAGDSFTAAAVMGMLQGWPLETISQCANETAAHVCACDGAVPELPSQLRDRFQWNGPIATEPSIRNNRVTDLS